MTWVKRDDWVEGLTGGRLPVSLQCAIPTATRPPERLPKAQKARRISALSKFPGLYIISPRDVLGQLEERCGLVCGMPPCVACVGTRGRARGFYFPMPLVPFGLGSPLRYSPSTATRTHNGPSHKTESHRSRGWAGLVTPPPGVSPLPGSPRLATHSQASPGARLGGCRIPRP